MLSAPQQNLYATCQTEERTQEGDNNVQGLVHTSIPVHTTVVAQEKKPQTENDVKQ